jgi:arginyl-tRNA--protein-N-Asp/Glu arginylyltransferase
VREFHVHDPPKGYQPVHTYTIEIHRAMYTEELFNLYLRYEKATHDKVREPINL